MKFIKVILLAPFYVLAMLLAIILVAIVLVVVMPVVLPVELVQEWMLRKRLLASLVPDEKYLILDFPFDTPSAEYLNEEIIKPYRKYLIIRDTLKPGKADARYANVLAKLPLGDYGDCECCTDEEDCAFLPEGIENIGLAAIYPKGKLERHFPYWPEYNKQGKLGLKPEAESHAELEAAIKACLDAWKEQKHDKKG